MFVHETERMRPVAEDDDDTTHGTGTATPTSIMMQGGLDLLLFFALIMFLFARSLPSRLATRG